jgi:ABC-type amino acid transport substrate-binding protein
VQSTPVPVVDTCTTPFPSLDNIEQDSDLARVLRSGVARVCYSANALGAPFVTEGTDGRLTGIEPDTTTAAFAELGRHYERPVRVEFVRIFGAAYFPPLLTAVNALACDIVWARMAPNADRLPLLDFTCPYFTITNVLIAGPGQPFTAASASGLVACAQGTILCSAPLPNSNLVFKPVASVQESLAQVRVGEVQYAISTTEQLVLFIRNQCSTCNLVPGSLISTTSNAATRRLERPQTATAIVNTATTHSTNLRTQLAVDGSSVPAAVWRTEAKAALGRLVRACDATTRAHNCVEAVGEAFSEVLSDDDDDSSSS